MSRYSEGYQDALKDVADALTANGENGVRNWLADNLGREDLRPGEPTVTVEGTSYYVLTSGGVVCPECGATRSRGCIADHMASEHNPSDNDDNENYRPTGMG